MWSTGNAVFGFLECEFQADTAKPRDVWNATPATSTIHPNPEKGAKSSDGKVLYWEQNI